MQFSRWKKGFRISHPLRSLGKPCYGPQPRKLTFILRTQELQNLTGKSAPSVMVKIGMSYLIVECSKHKFRFQLTMVLSRSKEKSCRRATAWQPAYTLQLPKQELAVVLCQLDRGKIGMSSCKSTFARFPQLLQIQSSSKKSYNHLSIQRHQLQIKDKPRRPLKVFLLQSQHCLQSQSHLQHSFKREPLLSLIFKVSILQFFQGISQEYLGYLAQRL